MGCRAALFLVGLAACGARTGLEVPHDAADGGGGAGAADGGSGGGAGPHLCEELLPTTPAHVRLPYSGASVRSAALVAPTGVPGKACVISDLENDDGSFGYAHACFAAWSDWPGSLGTASVTNGVRGGISAAEGQSFGFAALVGDLGEEGVRYGLDNAPDVPMYLSFTGQMPGHRAVFFARGAAHYAAGLAAQVGEVERLTLARFSAFGATPVGEIACARGPIAARAVVDPTEVVVATSSGREFGRCGDAGDIDVPTRVQVIAATSAGGQELRYESVHPFPVTSVALLRGEAGGSTVVWDAGGRVSLVRLGPGGPLAPAVAVAQGSRGKVAAARHGDDALVAYVRSGAGGDQTIEVVSIDPKGELRALGSLDTDAAPWLDGLDVLVEPERGEVIVAYVGLVGSNVRAFARRLDCRAK